MARNRSKRKNKSNNATFYKVTCDTCGNDGSTLMSIECAKCNKWWHKKCADMDPDIEVVNEVWYCHNCSSKKDTADEIDDSDLREQFDQTDRELEILKRERELLQLRKELSAKLQTRQSSTQNKTKKDDQSQTNVPKNVNQPAAHSTQYQQSRRGHRTSSPLNVTFDRSPTVHKSFTGSGNFTITNLQPQQLTHRQTIPKDLPEFSGRPSEWPIFYSAFVQSSELCNFSNAENLLRLQRCLKGQAREYVKSLLNLPACVPEIMYTLEMIYGRPEDIADEQLAQIRKVPPPKADKLETIVTFSIAVSNFTATLEQAELREHLCNPMLLRELIDRLPPNLKLEWLSYRENLETNKRIVPNIKHFNDWLKSLSKRICTITKIYKEPDQQGSKSKNTKFSGTHSTDNDTNKKEENDKTKKCGLCKGTRHQSLGDCQKFHELQMNKRWQCVKSFKLCRICLKSHRPYCDISTKICGINGCTDSHHTLLHKNKNEPDKPVPGQNKNEQNKGLNGSHLTNQRTICRIIPIVVKGPNYDINTYAFLDSGSTVTMIEDWLLNKLEIEGNVKPLHLQWTGGTTRLEEYSRQVTLKIRGQSMDENTFLLRARSVQNLGLPVQTLDIKKLKEKCEHLKDLPLPSYKNARPSILIGLDNWRLANPLQSREGKINEPIASKCRLGWSVEGPCNSSEIDTTMATFTIGVHICECDQTDEIHDLIKSFYNFDRLPTTVNAEAFSMEDRRAQMILRETVRKVSDNRYEAGLLWKYDNFTLPNSRPMAIKRHLCLEKKLKDNASMRNEIECQIQSYITKGYARRLTKQEIESPPKHVWYLPIFPVVNPKKPDRVRIVFDAAAKVDGVALNTMLMKGPDLTASLYGVLIRFRMNKIGLSGDVSEMFHQVQVRVEDQGVQRFLYRFLNEDKITELVLERLTFGATCSPTIAQYVKIIVAKLFKEKYPVAAEAIIRDSYVDDQLTSAENETEAIKLGKAVTFIFAQAGYHIRNWRSNSKLVQETLEPGTTQIEDKLDLSGGQQIEKVLGMFWDTINDTFIFSFKFNKGNEDVMNGKKRATKRELLKIQMSIYDPIGLLANYIIQIKILIQDLWRTGSNWDEDISDEHQKRFEDWLSHKHEVEKLMIPRCYLISFLNWDKTETQLHVFVDAGADAYASVAYLRIKKDEKLECRLISAKTRVAPIRLTSIPRLELEAARLGARHAVAIKNALQIKPEKTFFWSDSDTVLIWIRSDAKANPAFVAHRIAEIQDLTDVADWRYVPSGKNIADEASKKLEKYAIDSNSRWYLGPEFLQKPESEWPKKKTRKPELTQAVIKKFDDVKMKLSIQLERFSNWWKLQRAVARTVHYFNVLKAKVEKTKRANGRIITSEELNEAEVLLIKLAQRDDYHEEVKALMNGENVPHTSKIIGMNPYLDNSGVMRSNNRLDLCQIINDETRRPIIMPPRHKVTKLIIRYYHERLNHQNHETVLNNLRQKYWIPTSREVLRRIRQSCPECKIQMAEPESPMMAPLPEDRISMVQPFTHVGVDVFGPISVVLGRKTENRYGVIFTCLNTRAVYIHITHSMSTDSFIMAFQTFTSRRGTPRVVYSDNGKNFVGAEKILKKQMKQLDREKIADKFTSSELEWKFNPPLSPHMGGAWERLIRSVKRALYACLPKSRKVNDETLTSLMALIEYVINSRPLTHIPTDDIGEALTPNHWLLGSGDGRKPLAPLSDDVGVLRNSWRRSEELANIFWKRWVTEYLPTLARRTKWTKPTDPLKVDDIVIIVDKDLPRNSWPRARVIEVNKAKDGQVRSATVQTVKGIYTRPAVMLAKLDLSLNEESAGTKHAGENVTETG